MNNKNVLLAHYKSGVNAWQKHLQTFLHSQPKVYSIHHMQRYKSHLQTYPQT